MQELLFMEPYLKEVIWGGTRLRDHYAYSTDSSHIGEAWVISAAQPGCSTVKNGKYKGKTLKELWDEHRELFGDCPGDSFPLLVKLVDASDDLSIQVHPDDAVARSIEGCEYGKAECWYILDASDETDIILGHQAATKKELTALVENGQWDQLLRVLPLRKGDFLYNPPGSVHAIRKGTLLLEIQQNSDVTYRLYDYDRLQNGKKRPLHLEKSLNVITCPQTEFLINHLDSVVKNEGYSCRHLISCPYFSADYWKNDRPATDSSALIVEQPYPFLLVDVIGGQGKVNGIDITAGDNFLAPVDSGPLHFTGAVEFITSHI